MELIFSDHALRNLKKLDRRVQTRIVEKLEFYAKQEDPLASAEKLIDSAFGEWRFRIGNYRTLCDIKEGKIIILKIGHRREIYK